MKYLYNIIVLFFTFMLTACGGGAGDDFKPRSLQSITLTPSSSAIYAGERFEITAVGVYSDGSTRSVNPSNWQSSDNSVVDLTSGNSFISAKAAGEATITALVTPGLGASVTGTLVVKVLPGKVLNLQINGFSGSFSNLKTSYATNDERQLSVKVNYTDGLKDPILPTTWSSSNSNVITVSADGYMRAISTGTATVRAQNGILSQSQTLSIVTADERPAITLYCNQGNQAPLSASVWNSKIAADPLNTKEWLIVDFATCNANNSIKLLYKEPTSDTLYNVLAVANRNLTAQKFVAPLTAPVTLQKGQTLTIGSSRSENDLSFSTIFELIATD
jgi:hypothetical protein